MVLRLGLILFVVTLLTGCTRAPDETVLQQDLQNMVESGFAPGLLEVVSVQRASGWPFLSIEDGRAEIHYETTLRLKRDHRFDAWNQISAGVLLLLLDAAPEKLDGIKHAGNVAGDLLHASGRLHYRETDSGLAITRPEEIRPLTSDGILSNVSRTVTTQWQRIRDAVSASNAGITLEEWRRTTRVIAARTSRRDGGYAIATDRESSPYWRVGRAVARAARDSDVPFTNLAVDGPAEALEDLRDGRVSAAIVRSTDAILARAAQAPYEATGPYRIVALASLYPEPIHVVVKADSPFGSPADLYGHHVAVADAAQAGYVDAETILRAHGVTLEALTAPLARIPAEDTLNRLTDGTFDAVVLTAPLPSAALYTDAGQIPLRLLPFDSDAIALLTSGAASYVAITLPARTYPGQTRPLAGVAAIAMLVSNENVPPEEGAGLLSLMLNHADYLAGGSRAGIMISRSEARQSLTLPWHKGTALYFETARKD